MFAYKTLQISDKKVMAQTYDSPAGILAAILFLMLPLLFFIFNHLKSHSPPLPPGPTSWPILGTIHHFFNPITHVSLAHLAKSYGPLMHLRLGTQHLIIGSSPAAALEILKTNDRLLSARAVPHAVPLTPAQVRKLSFWADSITDHWKSIRAVCRTELFSAKAVEAQAGLREEKVAEMVETLRLKQGTVTDVQQIVYVTVVNMFSNVFFSKDFLGLEEEFGYGRMKGVIRGIIGAISAPNLADFYPFLGKLDLQGLRKKHRELSKKMRALWETIVKERRDSERGELRHQDFLDNLLSRGFGDDQINQLLEDLFAAGIDTTTSTINRTIVELIAHPKSLSTLRHELHAAFKHQHSLTTSTVDNLPYLQACVKETLRLHPPAPLLLSHRARQTCKVMDHTIPKNARVLVNVWAIGRDPTVWEDPVQYLPERFLGLSMDFKGNDFELLPFGAGRRICPGLPLAAKIVPLVVASLVYFFDWSSLEGTAVDEMFRATSRMKDPLLLIPIARK